VCVCVSYRPCKGMQRPAHKLAEHYKDSVRGCPMALSLLHCYGWPEPCIYILGTWLPYGLVYASLLGLARTMYICMYIYILGTWLPYGLVYASLLGLARTIYIYIYIYIYTRYVVALWPCVCFIVRVGQNHVYIYSVHGCPITLCMLHC